VIFEKDVQMSFQEILVNLFLNIGSYRLLKRRLSRAKA